MVASRHAQIQMEATCAPVMQAMSCQVMDMDVMVSMIV